VSERPLRGSAAGGERDLLPGEREEEEGSAFYSELGMMFEDIGMNLMRAIRT